MTPPGKYTQRLSLIEMTPEKILSIHLQRKKLTSDVSSIRRNLSNVQLSN